jgi:hypothetical protein
VPRRVARGVAVAGSETVGAALVPLRVARGDGVAVPETGGEALVPWRVARGGAVFFTCVFFDAAVIARAEEELGAGVSIFLLRSSSAMREHMSSAWGRS